MAANILDAYEGTLEEDFPPESERYEHSEMLLYKVMGFSSGELRLLIMWRSRNVFKCHERLS